MSLRKRARSFATLAPLKAVSRNAGGFTFEMSMCPAAATCKSQLTSFVGIDLKQSLPLAVGHFLKL